MNARDRMRTHLRARLASWRAREALARTPRYRVVERRALRQALVRSTVVVAVVLVAGALFSTVADPLLGPELLGLNVAVAAVSLLLGRLVKRRARRQVAGVACLWGILMAADLLAAGLTSPLQLRNSAMIMPAIPPFYALFMPWTTRAHLIAVGWTTVAALLLAFALQRSGIDPVSPIVITAIVTGAISVVGHALRRADRVDAFRQVMQIRGLHARARDAGLRLRETNRELASSARLDTLTGAGNRLALEQDLRVLDVDGDVMSGSVAFVLVDLDRFKPYNDRHGHPAGDWVLRRVAEVLAESVRSADRVYRYGGEEMLVLLADVDEPAADGIVGRMLMNVHSLEIPHPENRPWQVVTASAGWILHEPGGSTTSADAIAAADEALYRAKRLGRNRAVSAARPDRIAIPA
ncbi:MAG: GGDEF domain-containing protein [Chloroflexota bacterium]